MSILVKLADLDLRDKTLLVRADYNVPMEEGRIMDDTRIRASLPTLKLILEAKDSHTAIMSHLGRPKEGATDPHHSLAPVAERLGELLGMTVPLARDWVNGVEFGESRLALCENVRFLEGETSNDDSLARRMAKLCDIYVNDAFATAHRKHASTYGIAKYSPLACAGPLLVRELKTLNRILDDPKRPLVAIVGGAKISGKLELLESLMERVDALALGGGIANAFLCATGCNVGKSLHEAEHGETAKRILKAARRRGCDMLLPLDAACLDGKGQIAHRKIGAVGDEDAIMDIGPETAQAICALLRAAQTVVWNGPLGAFEQEGFAAGTEAVAECIAKGNAFAVAGGGDTLAAIARWQLEDGIDYISTGGGAFLQFMEGKTLVAVSILDESARAWEAMERARDF